MYAHEFIVSHSLGRLTDAFSSRKSIALRAASEPASDLSVSINAVAHRPVVAAFHARCVSGFDHTRPVNVHTALRGPPHEPSGFWSRSRNAIARLSASRASSADIFRSAMGIVRWASVTLQQADRSTPATRRLILE